MWYFSKDYEAAAIADLKAFLAKPSKVLTVADYKPTNQSNQYHDKQKAV